MILVRYVLREHFAPFVAALLVITFLFVIDFFVNILDSVLSKGLPLGIVVEIFVLNLAWMLALSVPMACLVSCLMAFGRMSSDHEITAVKSAGHPPFLLMRPVMLVASLLMVLLTVFNNWVLPEANHRAAALMSAISRKQPHAFIDAGRLLTQFPGVQIWVDQIDKTTGTLYGIQIFEQDGRLPPRLVLADSATIEYLDMGATLLLRLRDGENHILDDEDPNKYFRIRFQSQDFAIRNVDDRLERRERSHRGDRELPVEDMLEVVREASENHERITTDNAAELWTDLVLTLQLLRGDTLVPESMRGFAEVPTDPLRRRTALAEVSSRERQRERRVERIGFRIIQEEKRISQYWVEIHKKFSIPVACLAFVLIGAPLGIMARKGGIGTGVLYSIFFFIVYWVFLIGGENLADRLFIRPAVAMWTPNVVIGIIGLIITWRMSRDNYSGNGFWSRLRQAVFGVGKVLRKMGRQKQKDKNP